MTLSYDPSKDEMRLTISPLKGKSLKTRNGIKVWADKQGHICALSIFPYTKLLEGFKKDLHTLQLKGFLKGVKVTKKDIQNHRKELLHTLEKGW